MNTFLLRSIVCSIAFASSLAVHGQRAEAAPSKVWVAYYGFDSGACGNINAPCATFQQAHNNVAAGGDVGVLTPGDYGSGAGAALNISKSINVTNDGTGEASIQTSFFGQGIFIDAGVGGVVSLRGLVIDGQGIGDDGIHIQGASAVHIQNCVIRNFQSSGGGVGIFLVPEHNTQLFVSDTIIFNNGSVARSGGIWIRPFLSNGINGSANVVLDRVRLENNVRGLWVDGSASSGAGSHVIIRDSVVSGNAADGILATSGPGQAPSFIVVEQTSSVNNAGTGIRADGARATILLDGNSIKRNGAGLSATNSGQLISYGNNKNNTNVGPEGAPTGFFSQM